MAKAKIPIKAKLFIGVLFRSEEDLKKVKKILEKKYGKIDYETAFIPFTHTEYYKAMGSGLFKIFYSFEKLIKRDAISSIKGYTNRIEDKFSDKKNRRINIDPGYLTLSNVYLASCKEFFHRAYLTKGVYLENEYKYTGKKFHFWEWTYPDYKKEEYLEFFYALRDIYYQQIR